MVKSLSVLRLERSPIIGPETDTPDKVVQVDFGEELVAGVHELLEKGGDENLVRLPSKRYLSDVVPKAFG